MSIKWRAFTPNTWEAEVDVCELKACLVYIRTSRPTRAMQWDPVSKTKQLSQTKEYICYNNYENEDNL